MWGLIASLVGGGFKDWLQGRQKLEQIREEAKVARVANGIPGWSDEFLVLVWSYPFIAQFMPGIRESALQGLTAAAELPGWYIGGFMSISFAVFGINKLFQWKKK
ncbi:hypothetical protein ACJJI5_12390 [Microbulbifer sp. EKSA008]|uniref:hypothetical protein n=1 Tax=Microbulbifer sp. EKSA008 TaxID=3243367 RepID=UPI0040430EE2